MIPWAMHFASGDSFWTGVAMLAASGILGVRGEPW